MRTVKYSNLTEKNHGYPAAFALIDLRPKFNKQRFNVSPLNIGANGAGKNSLKGFLVPFFTLIWYHI